MYRRLLETCRQITEPGISRPPPRLLYRPLICRAAGRLPAMAANIPLLVVLMTCWCCRLSSSGASRVPSQSHLLQMMDLTNSLEPFRREARGSVDLREHRLFTSNPQLDCCPTLTEKDSRTVGINPQGLLLELFHSENFTQTFYETICHPKIKDRPCQFIDRAYQQYSRCTQQYSYVYALGRTYRHWYEQFRIDYIRVATGCKCQLLEDMVSDFGPRHPNDI